MYENLYEPLPDIEEYLNRIHISHPITIDKKSLDDLIYAHQCYIPFENLDVCLYKKDISLGISDLFHKIIRNQRGGYCFEMNALFFALLKAIGYCVHACLVKVCAGEETNVPALHRGTIVTLDNALYYCDIGFGGPVPGGAIKLDENTIQTFHGENCRFTKRDENWWILSRISSSGKEEPLLLINPAPKELEDFVALSHYCSCHTHKDFNFFTENIMANIRIENQGHYSLVNNVLKKKTNDNLEEIIIKSPTELITVLHTYFHLNIKDSTETELINFLINSGN